MLIDPEYVAFYRFCSPYVDVCDFEQEREQHGRELLRGYVEYSPAGNAPADGRRAIFPLSATCTETLRGCMSWSSAMNRRPIIL